jgi:hypothetical protein
MFQDLLVFVFEIAIVSIAWVIVWNWKLKHVVFIKKLFTLSDVTVEVEDANIKKVVKPKVVKTTDTN